jgi:hypothetical protein
VAKPSKTQRKINNANRSRRNAEHRYREAVNMNGKLAETAIQQFNNGNRVARLLAVVVAKYGDKGELRLPMNMIAALPQGAALREMQDNEKDEYVLMTVVNDDEGQPAEILEAAPQIEVVTPQIEVVSR